MVALSDVFGLFASGIGIGIILSVFFYFVGVVIGLFNGISRDA